MNVSHGAPEILFRCDASEQIGGGHIMRCLTLANALSEHGVQVTFVAATVPDNLAARISAAGHNLQRIPPSSEMRRERADWEEPPISRSAQIADAYATGATIDRVDWAIVDHYLLDEHWHSTARKFAGKIMVIDDLANRSYDCDVLLDQTFGRTKVAYRELVPDGATVLAGTTYALLRPEFSRERPAALERRKSNFPAARILVSMGTTDPQGVSATIVEKAICAALGCAIDVVVGPQAASLGSLRALADKNPRVTLHSYSDRMAELMRDADIAIGGAGTTSWERCCLALPTIVLPLADNQRPSAEALESAGAALLASSVDDIPPLLSNLISDPVMRLSLTAAAAAICDGEGAALVVDKLLHRSPPSREVALRRAQDEDIRDVWVWRNDFTTRCQSQSSAPVLWPDHEAWWRITLEATDAHLLVAELAGAPVAALRFDRVGDAEFEVSINLAPKVRGSGLGGEILAKACSDFRDLKGPVTLIATIHRKNPASRSIFERLGFVRAEGLSNSGFERYVLPGGTAE